ncbi:glycosyltransferase [Candidatus Dependentiae bacterium]|nr:glycosyltransferase [Candidatus Dependentiae bacterium]
MKVLVVGHAYIASINREKWRVFAKKFSDIKLKILIPKKWSATLFNINAGDLSEYNSDNCEFISINTFKSGNEVLYGYNFFALIKLLKKFKPDLIHVEQGDNAFSYFQLIFLSKIFCRKAKFIFFTWVNWKNKWSLKYKLFWKFIEKFNLKNSSGAIVGNIDAAKILREKKFTKPLETLLQLGVNEKYFIPARKINNNKFKIGFIGRLIKEKGILDLVRAFNYLKKFHFNWELMFVGDGKNKMDLINYINKLNLSSNVKILDPVDHTQVGSLLSSFDIFVLPSYDTEFWREQFGHVLIEAMACKVPVIGSTGGEIPKVIGDSGLIFEQKNINDLVEKLKNLMDNKILREKLSLKGYDRFKNNFSYEIIAKKTYAFWKSIF